MVEGYLLGKMAKIMKVTGKMVRNRVMAYGNLLKGIFMRDNG